MTLQEDDITSWCVTLQYNATLWARRVFLSLNPAKCSLALSDLAMQIAQRTCMVTQIHNVV